VEQIGKVQKRATKFINAIRHIQYQKRLQILDLSSLVYRRYRGDMIEVYKFTHGIYWSGYSLLKGSTVRSKSTNWWNESNDVASHSWERTFSPSELLTYGTDFQVI